jgi:hypothetical protein
MQIAESRANVPPFGQIHHIIVGLGKKYRAVVKIFIFFSRKISIFMNLDFFGIFKILTEFVVFGLFYSAIRIFTKTINLYYILFLIILMINFGENCREMKI